MTVYLFDAMGAKVKEVLDEQQKVGVHRINIDLMDVPRGMYFIQLQSNNQRVIRKVVKL